MFLGARVLRGCIDAVPGAACERSARRGGADARVLAALLRVPSGTTTRASGGFAGRHAARARHATPRETCRLRRGGQVSLNEIFEVLVCSQSSFNTIIPRVGSYVSSLRELGIEASEAPQSGAPVYVLSEPVHGESPAVASALDGAVAALATPPNSYSAVTDPIDLVCGRGGDLAMLEVNLSKIF